MATSKTLTPTNVTIQIPAMTDAPDQSVNSNCIDKLGDAVNTLNSHMANLLRVTDATGTVSNLAPHGAVSVPLSLSIPDGYRLYMYGPLRTSGFVGGGYMLNNTTAWVFNPTDNAVSGTITIGVLCLKNL